MTTKNSKRQFFVDREVISGLAEVGQLLAAGQPLALALARLVQLIGETLDASAVVLYRVDLDTGLVQFPPVVWGEFRQPKLLQKPLKQDAIVFKMLKRKRPFYAANASADWDALLRIAPGAPVERFIQREGIKSSVGIPMLSNTNHLGVLFVNYRERHEFSPRQKDLIELFRSQIILLLHDALLLEKERRSVRQVSMAISSESGLEETAGQILDELKKVVGYQKATIQLIQQDNRTLLAFRGFSKDQVDPELLCPLSQDRLIQRVVAKTRPFILSNTVDEPDWVAHNDTKDVNSWVGVPLYFAKRLVGLLTLDHDQIGFYTPAVEAVLAWFADQAAVAVENAQLLESANHRIRDLQILNGVIEIMSGQLNTQELLKAIVDRIREGMECSHCTFFSPQPVNGKLMLVADIVSGEFADNIRTRQFKPGEGLAGWVYKTGKGVVLADARSSPHFIAARANPDKPRSMMVIPVRVGGRTVGVISADQDKYGQFNNTDLSLLETLGNQAGIAIQRNNGLDLLGKISRRINTVEGVDEILQLIVAEAIKLSKVSSGVIYLVSQDGKHITRSYKYPGRSFHPEPRMDKEDGLTRQVIAHGMVVRVVDATTDERVNPVLRKPMRSMIGLPLTHDGHVIGVLFLNDRLRHEFSDTEVSLLTTLADQAAAALYKADLLANLERQMRMHQSLNKVGLELTDQRNEKKILNTVARSAVTTMACWHCSVFRLQQDKMIIAASHGKLRRQLYPGRTFPLGEGIAGWVAQNGKPALVMDTEKDPRFARFWTEPFPKSLVIVPIWLDRKVYGVISAEDPRPMVFQESDLRLMQTFALQVSQALRIARQITDLTTLNQASREISREIDLDRLLETLLATVKETMNCLVATLFTVDADNELAPYRRQAAKPREQEAIALHFQMGRGLAGWVAKHRKSLLVPNVNQDRRFIPSGSIPMDQPYSMLLAPLVFKDRLLGVISVDKKGIGGFDKHDQRLLEMLASQAAVIYENARLLQESLQRVDELAVLHNVSTGMMTLDTEALLGLLLQGALRVTHTEVGAIYLLSENGERIVRSLGQPDWFSPAKLILDTSGFTRQIFTSKDPVIVADVENDPHVSSQIKRMGIRSFIGLPLIVGDRVIGVLYLNDQETHRFTQAEIDLGKTLASQAAAAIENARLFERAKKNTSALQRIVQIVRTIGAGQDPLPVILEETIQVFPDAYFGSFALVDPEAERLVFQAIYKNREVISKAKIPRTQQVRDWNAGITGYVAREGQAHIAGDVSKDKLYQLHNKSTVSVMVVPLKAPNGQVIGILNLESRHREAFGPEDALLCQDLGSIAAIAMEKGELYQDLEQRVSHLDGLSHVARQVGNLPAQQEIFNTVVQIALETLRAVRCILFVYDQEGEDRVLLPKATAGMHPKDVSDLKFRPGQGLAGWVAQQGYSLRTPDATQEPHFWPDKFSLEGQARPMVLAPLWVENQVTGVLSVERVGEQDFDLDDQRFLEILAVETGIFLLRRRHLEQIRRRFNPYIVGEPITDPLNFYGRKKLIQNIQDGIHNNHYIIYGERRIGKTSLLYQLAQNLGKLSFNDQTYYFLPIHFSIQGIPEKQFCSFLAGQIQASTGIRPKAPLEETFNQNDLQKYLFQVFEVQKTSHPNRQVRIVLLIDEIDTFLEYDSHFHARFRNMIITGCSPFLHMIMAGLVIRSVQTDTSPWFNMLQIIKLAPLEKDDARELVTAPVAGYYSFAPDALDDLLWVSDFKPIELQRLAYLSVNAMLDRTLPANTGPSNLQEIFKIQLPDVELAIQNALREKDAEYQEFWDGLVARQQQSLLDILKADGWIADPGKFTQAQLHNITCVEANRVRFTHLFALWLKGKNG
jgi:GAF domain-containing protein